MAGAELFEWDVIEMRRGYDHIFAGRHSGEVFEVVDEVGLIVVAGFYGEVCTAVLGVIAQRLQDVLETAHALKGLGREAGLFAEEFFEVTRAEAYAVDHVLYLQIVGWACKGNSGECDGWMQERGAFKAGKKRSFKNGKHGVDADGRKQLFADERSVCGPDVVERECAMCDFAGGHAEEGKCSAGAELDADDSLLLAGVEEKAIGSRAAEYSRGVGGLFDDAVGVTG